MKKKILFAFYPLFVKYNHGIALLSALCKERGVDTDIYVLDSVKNFSDYILKNRIVFVGFTCVTEYDYKKCLPFMEEARRIGCISMLGGVYIRRGTDLDAPVDFICRGEGESLPDFLLHGDGKLFEKKMLCEDINALPLPDYELFRDIPFERDIPFLKGKKVLPYHSSRGCPYSCSFCEIQGQPKVVRCRYKVQEDLSYLIGKYSPDIVFVGDELLPYYNQKWRESWEDFRHPFVAYIRADIPEDMLVWLHNRGMKGCAFGVESGDEQYRNEVLRKGLQDYEIFRTVEMLKRLRIEYVPFYMTDTPGETFAIKAKTFRMSQELGGYPVVWKYENLFEMR
ncbi:MAG: hypothetical protein M1510_02885 [Nitrospirae bacterium]|nr:hypothetical protein [Nitrospirota bacterium]